MEETDSPKRKWNPNYGLRTSSSQLFIAKHRRATITANKKSSNVNARERDSMKRRGTISRVDGKDSSGNRNDQGDATSQPLKNIGDAKAAIKAMDSWPSSTVIWEQATHSDDYSLTSPITLPLTVKDNPVHHSERQSSESEPFESFHEGNFPRSRLPNVPNEREHRPGRIEQTKRYTREDHPLNSHPNDRDSDHNSQLQIPNSGNGLSRDDGVKRNDQSPLPIFPEPDGVTNETSGCKDQAVSDRSQTPDKTGTSSDTPPFARSNERDGLSSQSQPFELKPTLVDISPMHDLVEEKLVPEIGEPEEAPDTTPSPATMDYQSHGSNPSSPRIEDAKILDSQANRPRIEDTTIPDPQATPLGIDHITSPDTLAISPGSDHIMSLDSRADPSGSDRIPSPDPQPQSPETGGVTVHISPTQDDVGVDLDSVTWLDSRLPLPGNYRAILDSPISTISDRSSNAGSGRDSLIISPTISSDQEDSEEGEDPRAAIANAEIMRLFDEFEANSRLEPPSEEQEAGNEREASDDSVLMSPDESDGNPTNSETLQDEIEKMKEKEASQAASRLFDLYGANFQLQRKLEEKEIEFKREIQKAWNHPRPPPTTREQVLDRLALEDLKSKRIFDGAGEQQRPIRTDPQMVLLETKVNILITRARVNHLLEDYPSMYTHAHHAAETARYLKFPLLTARCCYYCGMASYLCRDFARAKENFLMSRDCAGFYGISSESIERYIESIDNVDDPGTAIIKHFPAQIFSEVRRGKQKQKPRSTGMDNENAPSPSTARTLVGGSPRPPEDTALPPSPSSSQNEEGRTTTQPHEGAHSQIQTLHGPRHLGGHQLDGDPQPSIDDVPNYQPQEEAISEEIRKDILESKAQSLNPAREAGPAEAIRSKSHTLHPPSLASTEWTLLGSKTSRGTTKRVPRPYVAPIATSFPPAAEIGPASGSADEMDSAVVRMNLNTAREDATPDTAKGSDVEEFG